MLNRTPRRAGLQLARLLQPGLALAMMAGLAACGGDGLSPPPDTPAQALAATTTESAARTAAGTAARMATAAALPPAGTPIELTWLGRVSTQDVLQGSAGYRVPAIAPVYDVQTYRLSYTTIDGRQQPIVASGLLAVPQKAPGARYPVISYQHPTIFVDAQAPSNNPSASEPAVVMASLGYLVVAADYVGYGVSRGAPHPYLLSAPTAAAVLDLLTAARSVAALGGVALNGQLFMVGYSEGGYATVAAHRALQARGGPWAAELVGSAPGGGPLDVGATLDELLRRVREQNRLLAALVNPDLLQSLGGTVRRWVRDEILELLLPGEADVVFQTTFIDNFLANDRAAINRDSDVHDWRPDRAIRLFHGRDDQTVPFIGSASAAYAMLARGAPNVQWLECSEQPASHLACVPPYWQYMLSQMALVVRDL